MTPQRTKVIAGGAIAVLVASTAVMAAIVLGLLLPRTTPSERNVPLDEVLAYDRDRPLNVQAGPPREQGAVTVRNVYYDSFDGQRVPAVLATPKDGRVRGCMIVQPQLGAAKEATTGLWDGMAALGLASFSIDVRDTGARVADPVARLTSDVSDPQTLRPLVADSAKDLRRAIDALEERGICRGRIGMLGVSLGGALSSLTIGADDRVKAAVILSTPPTWQATASVPEPIIMRGYDRSKLDDAGRYLHDVDPATWLPRAAPRRVMLINGRDDPVVPLSDFDVLVDAAKGSDPEVIRYEGGHDPAASPDAPKVAERIAAFLRRELLGERRP